jgi:tetratricopeptide (TPR) repeat protein
LAREQGALVIAWPRWDMAVITPAAPPLGLVAGGLGLLVPPDELVVHPERAAEIAGALAALLDHPSLAAAAAAQAALAPIGTLESELWRVVVAGWTAALARAWEQLEHAFQQAYALVERPALSRVTFGGALLALGVLALEAGEPAGQAGIWLDQAVAIFTSLGLETRAGLARWGRAQALERQGLAAEARGEAEVALRLIDPAGAPAVYALVLAGLATMRQAHAETPDEALAAGTQLAAAAQHCPAEANPLLAARLLAHLGDTYQATAHDEADLRQALKCYQRAAQLFRHSGAPEDLAAIQMNEGSAWQGLGGDVRGNLRKAIDCYHQALRVFTLAAHPAEYALIHNNLATAYLKMPMIDERDTMRQALAVQSIQEALKVYTIEEYPREYAMVQNNLGNALQYLPTGDRAEKLDRAIGAYHEALRVRSHEHSPVEYAVTLNNMANAYANLPAEDRSEVLARAAQSYAQALEIFLAHQLDDQAQTVKQALAVVRGDLAALDSSAR